LGGRGTAFDRAVDVHPGPGIDPRLRTRPDRQRMGLHGRALRMDDVYAAAERARGDRRPANTAVPRIRTATFGHDWRDARRIEAGLFLAARRDRLNGLSDRTSPASRPRRDAPRCPSR